MGLLLTRRPGETVEIGDDIKVTVTRISRNQVQLEFEAPDDVIIHRSEIADKIRAEKEKR